MSFDVRLLLPRKHLRRDRDAKDVFLGDTSRRLPNGPLLTQGDIDSQIELGWQEHKAHCDVILRRGLRPATAGVLLEKMARRGRTMLISDRITGRLEALAREFGVPYVDSAGKAWIAEQHCSSPSWE